MIEHFICSKDKGMVTNCILADNVHTLFSPTVSKIPKQLKKLSTS
jgi:hypothetical protein